MFCVCYLKNHGSVMFPFALLLLNFMFIASEKTYINQYAVHIKDGRTGLERVLQSTGLVNRGQIGDLEDHYFLEIPQRERRSASHSQEHHDLLSSHSDVHWFEQQIHRPRYKRDHIPNPTADNLNDNLYGAQWYLHGGGKGGYDMNVIPAWKKGYSGRDVVISILDDGIERTHPDLKENYDPYASYDVNSHDNDPMPRYDPTDENRHGTRCAGEVSAVANNTVCGVGIAPHSRIGGVRMLDGEVYDAVEAASLSFNRSHIDIYSASWGPDDDGRVVDGPGPLAKKAFIDGITLGRNKKGSIYVWASGNGGNAQDSCNCDGYTNSVYTLSISSTSERGQKPWYLEECSSTLATTYSSGSYNEKQIITVDLRGRCTQTHTGTSASAPLAAGVVALVLEANPSLTWRDVQYITLLSANPVPMVDGQWMTNALGRKVSLRYGYGLMDASAMVDLAEVWTNIPEQHICEVNSNVNNVHLDGTTYIDSIVTQACDGMANGVKFLEHVQVIIALTHKRRGDVIIYITSPSGTKSKLLPKRPNDRQEGEFKNWPFLSVHFWGEDPNGRWTLEIEDAKSYNPHGTTGGVLRSWSIVFHGTATQPINLKNGTSITPPATVKATTATTSQPLTGSTTSPKPFTCHFECKKNCTGPKPENCNACKNVRLGSTGACIDVCPEGFYNNEGYCQACDSTCKTCSGPTLSECLTCNTNRFYTEKHHICVDKCLTGYFKDGNSCMRCSSSCRDCENERDTCTACSGGKELIRGKCILAHNKPKVHIIIPDSMEGVVLTLVIICVFLLGSIVLIVGIVYAQKKQMFCWAYKYDKLPCSDNSVIAVDKKIYIDDDDDFSP
ncbi:furin-like protease kpc-1 isoform X2 [Patella vulgata]|uniref:furin-like protease kpc-1 isoform X2 n=1 Tax=Patella vulgata TaxID=6465 RepID=UPI0024A8CFEF|nr:furin-like protease kpc-1 isoform X2 [Patella vulgata]